MKIAIRVIAICEVVRILQNMVQLMMVHHDTGARDNAYAEFVKSLKNDDKELVRDLLEELDKQTDAEVARNTLRTACNGCRFVGWEDMEFPCVNCIRKSKDYYTSE